MFPGEKRQDDWKFLKNWSCSKKQESKKMTCFAECHDASQVLCSHFLAGCSNKMDTAYSDGGRVQKYSSVHGGAEELWWIKQGLANLGAETTAISGDANWRTWREWQKRAKQKCKWTLCESWYIQIKVIQVFKVTFCFSQKLSQRYREKLPLGHLSSWFLSSCPHSCSISELYTQVQRVTVLHNLDLSSEYWMI